MQWKTPNKTEEAFAKSEAKNLKLDKVIVQRVMDNRLKKEEVEPFLYPKINQIRKLVDIFDCQEWIETWRNNLLGSRVALFADYDVDGLTSSEIVTRVLKEHNTEILHGYADVESGFGLNSEFVNQAIEWKADWLVTVDCGSTQTNEIKLAQKSGIKVLVIDHHEIDLNNTADMHCNPKWIVEKKRKEKKEWLKSTKTFLEKVEATRRNISAGGEGSMEDLIAQGKEFLKTAQKCWGIEEKKLQNVAEILKKELSQPGQEDTLTGAPLCWIWGRSLWQNDEAPDWWYKEPLYLASLGLIADMGSMLCLENRAICRVANQFPPAGIKALAGYFEENTDYPTDLIRTKAALNLAKRWSKTPKKQIPAVINGDGFQAAILASSYVSAASRKDIMLQKARLQLSDDNKWISIKLKDCEEDAGQSGVIANNLARSEGRPCVVFVHKGNGIWKFSARNGKRNKTKIGELLVDPDMLEFTKITSNGETKSSLGGHSDVVSGGCTEENIENIIDAMNNWLPNLSSPKKNDFIWVAEQKVEAERIHIIVQQNSLLQPLGMDSWGVEVSFIGTVIQAEDGSTQMQLEDGSTHNCKLHADAEEYIGQLREWKFRVKSSEPWWFKESTPLEEN